MIAHIVLARWNDGVTRDQIDEAKADFLALTAQIPGIEAAYWGTRGDDTAADCPDAVVIIANDVSVIEAYHAHPDHVPLAEKIGAIVASLTGGNYELQ